MEPTFFPTPAEWRAWLDAHHDTAREVLVGYYKVGSGRPSITWPESVDEALCFGWIDGVTRRLDDERHVIRFTPRTRRSTWSAVNIARVEELTRLGLMRPSGLAAFEARTESRMRTYAYEQESVELDPESEQEFRANERAWTFFEAQPAWYRRAAVWWVVGAKREETRRRRLATLIADSEQGRTIRPLTRRTGRS